MATDKSCPAFIFKTEVIATQVRLKSGFQEAEEDVRERFHVSGRKHTFKPPRQTQSSQVQQNDRVDPMEEDPRQTEKEQIDNLQTPDLGEKDQSECTTPPLTNKPQEISLTLKPNGPENKEINKSIVN